MQEQAIDAYEIYLVKRFNKRFKSQNEVSGQSQPLYIMSKWPKGLEKEDDRDAKIQLVLQTLADGKCYCGELSVKEMEKAAVELNIDEKLFIGESRMALSAYNDSDTVALFEFELEQQENKILLIVCKQCLRLRMRYIEVELTEQSNNAAMLDALVALVQYMPYSAQLQQTSIQADANDVVDMTKAIECCVQAQEEMKQTMMKKFCVLLNSKKEKICELQEQLDQLKASDKEGSNDEETTNNTDDEIFNADTQPMQIN